VTDRSGERPAEPRPPAAHPRGAARPPAVAGAFYPADPARLQAVVRRLVDGADPPRLDRVPRVLVVPHAGYIYSGSVAAAAYVAAWRAGIEPARVSLAGPAHFVRLVGAAVPTVDDWSTPLGPLTVDTGLRAAALASGATADDRPHRSEHALEVQLPFLQVLAGPGLRILPLAVGPMATDAVADVLGSLAESADLLVVSTDLSHYLDEAAARRVDAATIRTIVEGDAEAIADEAACGVFALRGAVALARRAGWPIRLIARATSADAGGGRDRVVGYAALAMG
jgi:AmmeMemoRadiSam system protein B